MIDVIVISIVSLIVIDIILYSFNFMIRRSKRKTTQNLVKKDEVKRKLNTKIIFLNKELDNFKKNSVSKTKYNELVYKYNLILDQYRRMNNKNKQLKERIRKLKNKFY